MNAPPLSLRIFCVVATSDFFWIMKMCSVFGLEKMTKNYRRTRNKSRADACGYVTEIQISFKALSQKIG